MLLDNQPVFLSGNFYKTLLDSMFDAICVVDVQGNIMYWNESSARITGYTFQEMVGCKFNHTSFAQQLDETAALRENNRGIAIVLQTGMPGTWKGYITRKNGQRIPIESHISAIRNDNGKIIGAVEVFRDISAQLALEQAHKQLLRLSRKDQLTGLYNRTAIGEILKAETERSHRYNQPLAVIMIDIDHFKRINDTYGHDAGDEVLVNLGSILQNNLRQPDEVGRWGGEEFLVIAPNSDLAAAVQISQRLRQQIAETTSRQLPETITASFGVAQLGPEETHDQVLYNADQALYKAKNQGRNRVGTP